MFRSINSYYSNLIEGHNTHPVDIERALREDYSADPAKRALQLESRAHIELQEAIEKRLAHEPELQICCCRFLLETCVDQARFMAAGALPIGFPERCGVESA